MADINMPDGIIILGRASFCKESRVKSDPPETEDERRTTNSQ
jgi:hypothetical protein